MVKKLMESIREQKKNSILAMVTISGEVVFEVIIPLLMANLIDYGIDMGDMGYIVKMGIVLLLSALGQLFCGAISGKFAASASRGFARNLRHDMFYKVQNYSFSNIDKFSTASIVTRLTTDVTNLQNTYQMIIRMAVRSPLMAIFSLVAAFGIDAKLSLIFLAIIPVLILGLYFIMTRTHPIFERVFRTYDKLNSVVQENLHGIRVVKSFVREDHENKKFTAISENIYKDFKKAEQQLAWNAPLMQLCMYAAVLLLSWFGARTIVACGGDAATGLSTGVYADFLQHPLHLHFEDGMWLPDSDHPRFNDERDAQHEVQESGADTPLSAALHFLGCYGRSHHELPRSVHGPHHRAPQEHHGQGPAGAYRQDALRPDADYHRHL